MLTKRRVFRLRAVRPGASFRCGLRADRPPPYEIPNSAMARITPHSTRFVSHSPDSTMNDGTVPTSIILFQNGQPMIQPTV